MPFTKIVYTKWFLLPYKCAVILFICGLKLMEIVGRKEIRNVFIYNSKLTYIIS